MVIYIGADHRGFELKEKIKLILKDIGYEVKDVGNTIYEESDDYSDFASVVGSKISVEFQLNKGILICASGVGMSVVANKFPNVRAALVGTPDHAYDSRKDDDANVLCLSADHADIDKIKNIVLVFLETPFRGGERYERRLKKINSIETKLYKHE